MKAAVYLLVVATLGGGLFFFLMRPSTVEIPAEATASEEEGDAGFGVGHEDGSEKSGEGQNGEDDDDNNGEDDGEAAASGDIGPQPQLANPPVVVEGIYLTGWSAGSTRKMEQVFALLEKTGANAVVIDIKDYSGYVSYTMDVPQVKESAADQELRIREPNKLIKALHDRGIYVIGRVTVFQDPIFAKANPELALKSKANGGLWRDRKGLAWLDPAAKPAWDYAVAIAEDAFARGFDEINFDYIRFPSDGNLADASYPFWNETEPKHQTMARFFAYLRQALPGEIISADLFGLVTVAFDDLGIGQLLADAYPYFDYISPMVYPSHYAKGFIGYQNPAAYPYEVVSHSMQGALNRRGTSTTAGKLRPWLQDFNLGATYTPAMVQAQIKATKDVLDTASSTAYAGYLMWDPRNVYSSYGNIYN